MKKIIKQLNNQLDNIQNNLSYIKSEEDLMKIIKELKNIIEFYEDCYIHGH